MDSARSPAADQLASDRRSSMTVGQKFGLAGICLSAILLPFSVTGPGVALGPLAEDLAVGASAAQWILNSYNMVFAALMFSAGVAASRVGRRRSLIVGQVLFAGGSLLCASADSLAVIIAGRSTQGMAAALVLTAASQYIGITLSGRDQQFAFALLGSSFGAGLAMGPMLSGLVTDLAGWRAVFILCCVVATTAAAVSWRLPHDARTPSARPDLVGTALFTVALTSVCGYVTLATDVGVFSPVSVVLLLLSVTTVVTFIVTEQRVSHPAVDLSLLRDKTFLAVVLQPFSILATFAALLVFLPGYLQSGRGLGLTASGIALLPLTVPVFVLPLLVSRFPARISHRTILGASPLLMGAGLAFTAMTLHVGMVWVEIGLFAIGSGIGIAFGTMDSAAANVVPIDRIEVATGMFNSARLISETIGIAVIGSTLFATLRAFYGEALASSLLSGAPPPSPVTDDGLVTTWMWVFIGLALAGALASILLFAGIDDRALSDGPDEPDIKGRME